jgi:hypothetical protein
MYSLKARTPQIKKKDKKDTKTMNTHPFIQHLVNNALILDFNYQAKNIGDTSGVSLIEGQMANDTSSLIEFFERFMNTTGMPIYDEYMAYVYASFKQNENKQGYYEFNIYPDFDSETQAYYLSLNFQFASLNNDTGNSQKQPEVFSVETAYYHIETIQNLGAFNLFPGYFAV